MGDDQSDKVRMAFRITTPNGEQGFSLDIGTTAQPEPLVEARTVLDYLGITPEGSRRMRESLERIERGKLRAERRNPIPQNVRKLLSSAFEEERKLGISVLVRTGYKTYKPYAFESMLLWRAFRDYPNVRDLVVQQVDSLLVAEKWNYTTIRSDMHLCPCGEERVGELLSWVAQHTKNGEAARRAIYLLKRTCQHSRLREISSNPDTRMLVRRYANRCESPVFRPSSLPTANKSTAIAIMR